MLSRQGVQVGTLHVVVADADGFDALVVDVNDRLRVALADEVEAIHEGGVVLGRRHGRLRPAARGRARRLSAAALSRDEARRAALRAQGLLGADGRRGGPAAMLRRLGAVQLDTISVLARSHELVAYARLGAVGAGEGREGLLERRRLRVLVARRVRAAGRGVAAVRLPPALLPRTAAGAGTRCPRTRARACSTPCAPTGR